MDSMLMEMGGFDIMLVVILVVKLVVGVVIGVEFNVTVRSCLAMVSPNWLQMAGLFSNVMLLTTVVTAVFVEVLTSTFLEG